MIACGILLNLNPEISLEFGLKTMAVVTVCCLLILVAYNIWDPVYVLKNRSYIGETISLDIEDGHLIQSYNNNLVKIPFETSIHLIVPPKGLIISVGYEEIHVPSIVSKSSIEAFIHKFQEANKNLNLETKLKNPLIWNSWSK